MSVQAALGKSFDRKAPPLPFVFLFMTGIKDFPRKFWPFLKGARGCLRGEE